MPSAEARTLLDSPTIGNLPDVPEEAPLTPGGPRSPYFHHAVSGSAATFKPSSSMTSLAGGTTAASSSAVGGAGIPRTPSAQGGRTPSGLTRSTTPRVASGDAASVVGVPASNGAAAATPRPKRSESPAVGREREEKEKKEKPPKVPPTHRVRNTPHLPHNKEMEPAAPTLMHWSRAPVWGHMPLHGVRAHTVTLIDNMAWLFGGCDEHGCWKDVFYFNTETMQWAHPDMTGDIPPPCRAHTTTLVDRRLVVFGGGEGPVYYNNVYVLDTVTRRWSQPKFPENAPIPPPRRAHTSVLYKGRVWVFGGGNGVEALNDVWTLDVSGPPDRMRWEMLETRGKKPTPRGYHTANLIGSVMVIVGGSDGRECFSDIWCLNLDTLLWSLVKLTVSYRRLSHTATQVGSYLFIMGGHDGTQYTSELLLFNLVSLQYEPRAIAGKVPSPRGYHVSFLADSRMFIFGGFNGGEVFDDVHILDLAGAAYLPQVTSFKIDVE